MRLLVAAFYLLFSTNIAFAAKFDCQVLVNIGVPLLGTFTVDTSDQASDGRVEIIENELSAYCFVGNSPSASLNCAFLAPNSLDAVPPTPSNHKTVYSVLAFNTSAENSSYSYTGMADDNFEYIIACDAQTNR